MPTSQPYLLAPGATRAGAPLTIFGNEIAVKVGSEDSAGAFAVVEVHTPPGGGPPLHRHSREDETFYILEGEYTFAVDGRRIVAGPGACVFAPLGSVHTFTNSGSGVARMLTMVQPAGLDRYFADLAEAVRGMARPDPATMIAVAARHGLEILGPPLAAAAA